MKIALQLVSKSIVKPSYPRRAGRKGENWGNKKDRKQRINVFFIEVFPPIWYDKITETDQRVRAFIFMPCRPAWFWTSCGKFSQWALAPYCKWISTAAIGILILKREFPMAWNPNRNDKHCLFLEKESETIFTNWNSALLPRRYPAGGGWPWFPLLPVPRHGWFLIV